MRVIETKDSAFDETIYIRKLKVIKREMKSCDDLMHIFLCPGLLIIKFKFCLVGGEKVLNLFVLMVKSALITCDCSTQMITSKI